MDYIKNHSKLILSILFILVVLLGVFYLLKFNKNTDTEQIKITKTELSPDRLPEQFPADIPIEKGAKITQNYNATSEDGRFQATRTFETQKSLIDNLKLYQDYFKTSGWTVQATVDTENYKMISGTKDTYWIQVSISNNTVLGIKTVDISLTKKLNK